jgi:colanic acid/amylovoran biosynthesis protein
MNILLGSYLDSHSKGDMAVIWSIITNISKKIDTPCFTVPISAPSHTSNLYSSMLSDYKIKLIPPVWYKESNSKVKTIILSSLNIIFSLPSQLKLIKKNDIYLELGTFSHCPYYGFVFFLACFYPLLFCILFNKPFIICGESMGPYNNKLYRWIAKPFLKRAKLITVRDDISKKYLEDIGITDTNLVSDLAFLLEPATRNRIDYILNKKVDINTKKHVIGISASQLIHTRAFSDIKDVTEKYSKYITMMANITDYIIKKYNVTVFFISHSTAPRANDIIIHEEIYKQVINKKEVIMFNEEYTSNELKGIIGICKMFIGCRMHANIAAVSQCIPTIALSYGHKFHGGLKPILNDKINIINLESSSYVDLYPDICTSIDYVWNNRSIIREILNNKMVLINEKANLNIELVTQALKAL